MGNCNKNVALIWGFGENKITVQPGEDLGSKVLLALNLHKADAQSFLSAISGQEDARWNCNEINTSLYKRKDVQRV